MTTIHCPTCGARCEASESEIVRAATANAGSARKMTKKERLESLELRVTNLELKVFDE